MGAYNQAVGSGHHLTSARHFIPVTRFWEKVLAHSANSIAVLHSTLNDGIKFNSDEKKSDRSCSNGLNTATSFLE